MPGDGVRFSKAPALVKAPELVPKMSVTRQPSNAPRLDPHATAQTRQLSSSPLNGSHRLASLLTQDPARAPAFDVQMLEVIRTMCGPEFKPDQLTAFIRTLSQCPRAFVIAQLKSFYLLGSAIKETYPHARIQRLGFLGEEVLTVDGKTRLLAQKDIQLPGMQKPVWDALKVLMRPEVTMKEHPAERRAKAVLAMVPDDARSGSSPNKANPGSGQGAKSKAPVHDTKSTPSGAPAPLERPPNTKPVAPPRDTAAKEVRAASQAAKPLAASAAIPRHLEDVMQMPVDTKADVDAFYQNVLALAYAESSNTPRETCARFLQDAFAKFHSGELGGSRLELVVSALAQSLGGPDMRAPMARHFMECISVGAGNDVEAAQRGVRAFALALASDRADSNNRAAALDVIGRGFGRLEDHDKAFLPSLFKRTADDWRDTWLTAYHPESEQPAPKPAQDFPVPAASLRASSGAKPVAKPAMKEKVQADAYRSAIRERFEGKYRRQALEAFESGLKSAPVVSAAAGKGSGNGADSKHSQGNIANRAAADKPMDVNPAPVKIVQDGGPSSTDSRQLLGTKEPRSSAPSSIPPQPASREAGAASVGKMLDAYRGKALDAKFTAAILAAQDDQDFADAALATYKAWLSEGAAPRSLSQALRNEFVDSVKPSYGGEKNPNLDQVTGSLRALAKTLDPLGPQAIELRRKIKSSFHEDLQAPMLLALNGTTPQDKFEAMERVLLQIEHMDASRDSERYPVYISALRARSGDQRALDHLVKALAEKIGPENLCNEFAWILNRRLAQTGQRGGAALHEMGMSALFKALGGPSMTTQAASTFVKAISDSLDPKESKRLSREPIPLSSAQASMEALGYVLGDVRTKGRSARTEHVLTVIQQSKSAHREVLERAFRDGISRADPEDPAGWDPEPL